MAKPNKGFSHYYSVEILKKYLAFSPKDKLLWLEEINKFSYKAMTTDRRKIWNKLRQGEL